MKKYVLTLICLLVGAGCLIAFNIIGTKVLPDGRLIEPFFLLLIGYLLIFIGMIIGIVTFLRSLKKKK